jgi:hypothetical protein
MEDPTRLKSRNLIITGLRYIDLSYMPFLYADLEKPGKIGSAQQHTWR